MKPHQPETTSESAINIIEAIKEEATTWIANDGGITHAGTDMVALAEWGIKTIHQLRQLDKSKKEALLKETYEGIFSASCSAESEILDTVRIAILDCM